MPTLNWIGKEAVINHHKEVPFRLLNCDETLSVGEPDGNLLIEGDNLEALKALLPYYAGQVKCVYIDPPYNTGNEKWVYNDNVNSPQIRAWLGKTVGGEGEDLSRHDKWLCMMYPRLCLLRELLREDGVIIVAVDDNELVRLQLIMDEVFEERNRLGTLVWEKTRKNDAKFFSLGHDYMLVYGRNVEHLRSISTVWREPKPGAAEIMEEYRRLRTIHGDDDLAVERALQAWYGSLPKNHPSKRLSRYKHVDTNGVWRDRDISWPGGGGPRYEVIHPTTGEPCRIPDAGWRFATPESMQRQIDLGLVVFREDHTEPPLRKAYLAPIASVVEDDDELADEEEQETEEFGLQVMPSVIYKHTQPSVRLLRRIMQEKAFSNPKDHEVLARLIRYVTRSGDIVLDSFAGSGSTGHAVLQLNKENGGNRKFILVELESDIACNITAERLRRVIEGYTWTDQRTVEHREPGLGGGFRYCTLGSVIFQPDGAIHDAVNWQDLARHVWFIETRNPWNGGAEGPYLGQFNGVDYYLYFDGVGGNVFGPAQLAELSVDDIPKVIYADMTAIDEDELKRYQIGFRQIPYDVKVH